MRTSGYPVSLDVHFADSITFNMTKTLYCAIATASLLAAHTSNAVADDSQPEAAALKFAKIQVKDCLRPEYPVESRRNEEEGEVTLGLTISTEGDVTGAVILKSSGHRGLDLAAVESIWKCKFVPMVKDGVPVEFKTKFIYAWKLEPPPAKYLRQDAATGSNIRRSAVTSPLPMDKTYRELTAEQKAYVKSFYESVENEDEPPYPLNGLGSIYQPLIKAQEKLQVEGLLSMEVRIDGEGKAVSVNILNAPDKQMGNTAAAIAMLTKYKPAVCSGQPCTMSFPIRLDMRLRK